MVFILVYFAAFANKVNLNILWITRIAFCIPVYVTVYKMEQSG